MPIALPVSSNPLLFWMDPLEKFVDRDSTNKVNSVVERVTGGAILPYSGTSRPTWRDNIFNGFPVLNFNTTHSLRFNFMPQSVSSGIRNPIMITVAAQATSFPIGDNCIANLGSRTQSNSDLSLDFTTGPSMQAYRYDDTSVVADAAFTVAPPTPLKLHIYTAIYNGTVITLRIDGNLADSRAATNSTGHFSGDQIAIGNFTDAAIPVFGNGGFTGNIGQLLIYYGNPTDLGPENYLREYYGI